MPDPGEIAPITVEEELHTCPACGYALGFHLSFVRAGAGKDNPVKSTRDLFRVILICPECGARYDAGWRISFAEQQSRFIRTPARPATCLPHGNPADCLPPPHDERSPE